MSSNQDIRAAQATYSAFTGLMKWGTIAAAVVAAIVILLIAK